MRVRGGPSGSGPVQSAHAYIAAGEGELGILASGTEGQKARSTPPNQRQLLSPLETPWVSVHSVYLGHLNSAECSLGFYLPKTK